MPKITYIEHSGKEHVIDATAVWGRNHTIGTPQNANAYLLEATLHLRARQAIWMRIENADRTSDLLGANAPPDEFVIGRVPAYTAGYAYTLHSWGFGAIALGAQFTSYTTPSQLVSQYGTHPWGVAPFLKFQLGK